MRRLTEILAFPKAWYRRSIVRRLFLGDLSSGTAYPEDDSLPLNQEEAVMGSSLLKHYDRHACDPLSKGATERSPVLNREKLKLSLENDMPRQPRLKGILFILCEICAIEKLISDCTSKIASRFYQISEEGGVSTRTSKYRKSS